MAEYNNLSDGRPDGVLVSQSASDKIGFYGATPVVQGAVVTALATTPTATDIATAVNSIITRLKTVGLIASS